jgi:hypothetical protein
VKAPSGISKNAALDVLACFRFRGRAADGGECRRRRAARHGATCTYESGLSMIPEFAKLIK